MEYSQLHFAHPSWLLLELAIPLLFALYFFTKGSRLPSHRLESFIDSHLLPFLLRGDEKKKRFWSYLFFWAAAWTLLTLALAGPRSSFKEIETFSKDQSLVLLVDVSASMNSTDVKPSRLIRAKQKIEDLLNYSRKVKIGLIAFAADAHMIAPITDDIETIRHYLPVLDTDLVYVQGSRLIPAVEMASAMLDNEPGSNKALVILSDGAFEDSSVMSHIKQMAQNGVVIHTMGIGTPEGAPIKDQRGIIIKRNGAAVISKLEKEKLKEISAIGNGHYFEGNSSNHEEIILQELEKKGAAQIDLGKKQRIWEEQFYWPLLCALPLLLLWFRKGAIFPFAALFFLSILPLEALEPSLDRYFKNSEQLGKEAFERGDYEEAAKSFQDPYRKGIAAYRAGDFSEAAALFRSSSREEVAASAGYNLGNSLVQQKKLTEAVEAYEEVIKRWPGFSKAEENLAIVKEMMEQQQKKKEGSQGSEKEENEKKEDSGQDSKKKEKEQQASSSKNEGGGEQEKNKQNGEKKGAGSPPPKKEQKEENWEEELQKAAAAPSREKERRKGDERGEPSQRTQSDHDADLWLDKIGQDPKSFMKNKFYIESKKNKTTEGVEPW